MTLTTQTIEFTVGGLAHIGKVLSHATPQIGLVWFAEILSPEQDNGVQRIYRKIWSSRGHLTEKLARRALQRKIKAT